MPGQLELRFVDVQGEPIRDTVDIRIRHRVLSEERVVTAVDASQPIVIGNLRTEPQGTYVVEVQPRAYLPVFRFVTIPASGTASKKLTLPIDFRHARATFPTYAELDDRVRGVLERSSHVKNCEGKTGEALYAALSDEAKAGLLNIAKKSLVTPFRDGSDLLPHLTLIDVRGDRCFVEVPPALAGQMPSAVSEEVFRKVDGGLHDPIETGFQRKESYKTLDLFGNLQLTFFEHSDGRWIADVDIDDAAGLAHVFQVLRNHLEKRATHPYDIHQILVHHQQLDPGYRLAPVAAAAAANV